MDEIRCILIIVIKIPKIRKKKKKKNAEKVRDRDLKNMSIDLQSPENEKINLNELKKDEKKEREDNL